MLTVKGLLRSQGDLIMNYSVSYQMQCEINYAKQQGPITSKTVSLKTQYIHACK